VIVRYLDPLERLEYEVIQRREDGQDVQSFGDAFAKLQANPNDKARDAAYELLAELMDDNAQASAGTDAEPNGLDDIRRAASAEETVNAQPPYSLSEAELHDRLLGGWLGRAAGCLLGKPIERYSRPVIRELLESNDNWPLNDYWTQVGMPQPLLEKYPWKRRGGLASLRENIECMPEDDDLNYPMLNLHVIETFGRDFNSNDIGTAWLTMLPAYQVFTAERVAYFNLLEGREAPDSATWMNPYREWIGAQIRADLWGYVSPGNPNQAAEFAWRDARLSHTGNGIYGEMFFAALIANAFVESDVRSLVEAALTHIPRESRLAKAITVVLGLPIHSMQWEAVVDEIYSQFGNYHWVHTINNAALVVAALLKGNGDFEQTICNTVMGGWDTDSSGATAGSVVGVILGADAMPGKWIDPLNDQIRSSLAGFDNARFTDLARRTFRAAQHATTQPSTAHAEQSDDF
jgi:ADP-ribosylglycohydrolase